ncbi:MAG: 16S rRNA (cytosine(1402)-N(4))-methyltransferase [Deltaproteobacteria bacterium]|nr:MAG: 16S rRNA (cytosine(1402)-N(4))-methyltransferase [Deltaproteobacteria bacterium]
MGYQHVSVMAAELQRFLSPGPGDICVDGTLGGAGHALAICRAIRPEGMLIGLDQDNAAVDHACQTLSSCESTVQLFNENFVRLPQILLELGIDAVDAIVLDLGLSFYQLSQSGRGFSFRADEPLDMRMNNSADLTAAEIVNQYAEKELVSIFQKYGEERWSRRIARAVVIARKEAPITSSLQLAGIIVEAIPHRFRKERIHPATRVFMALRIAVNRELECLEKFLAFAPDLLKTGGRLCIIAFHSLEDRLIKRCFARLAKGCVCPPEFPVCTCGQKPTARLLSRKVIKPSAKEVEANPMARSARLRGMVRI